MKKPIINYGWKIPKKIILIFILIIMIIIYFFLFYNDKTGSDYISEQLSLYTRLNITSIKTIKSKDLNKNVMYGIESKTNLYNKNINTIDHYIGSIEVYSNEAYSRIRRTTLKHLNNYINTNFKNDIDYINNRTYTIYLYKNIILKINNNVNNKDEYFDDLKLIVEKINLNNLRTIDARKTEDITYKINNILENEVKKDYKKFNNNKYFYEF